MMNPLKLSSSRHLSGGDVVKAIVAHIDRTVPILVHSMNLSEAPVMVRRLESAGYDAMRMPMAEMTPEKLHEWVADARDLWEDSDR